MKSLLAPEKSSQTAHFGRLAGVLSIVRYFSASFKNSEKNTLHAAWISKKHGLKNAKNRAIIMLAQHQ
ncbi:MAG: hypothetical protein K8T25_13380 [Planctomycetia bacterium]|nr:hypothetical protein [Planctomycetia bacterium]